MAAFRPRCPPVVELSEVELERMRIRAYRRSEQAKIDRDRAEAEKERRREKRNEMRDRRYRAWVEKEGRLEERSKMERARETADRIIEEAQQAMDDPTESKPGYGIILVTCDECGLAYCTDEPEDVRQHKTTHWRFLKLSAFRSEERFGDLLWQYHRREDEKRAGHDVIGSTAPVDGRLGGMETVAYAWFCRAIFPRFERRPKEAPTFKEYCALISETVRKVFGRDPEAVEKFISKYGEMPGVIKRGFTELPESWKGLVDA
jgi:hypothetical protein